jgi:cytochrome c biogenesis protein CcdA
MILWFGALVAGVLTTLAPCVLPLLPVVVGGSLGKPDAEARKRAYLIATSLGASVVLFTLLLKATTALIDVPVEFWQWFSGLLLIALGVVSAYPRVWDEISAKLSLQSVTNRQLVKARAKTGTLGAVLTGSALGPVFTSCSPFYGYVIVTVLPASFAQGIGLLVAYVIGLCGTLLIVSLLGQTVMGRARGIANPDGWFRKALGVTFVLVGIAIILGLDKEFQTWVIENSVFRPWELDSTFIPNG